MVVEVVVVVVVEVMVVVVMVVEVLVVVVMVVEIVVVMVVVVTSLPLLCRKLWRGNGRSRGRASRPCRLEEEGLASYNNHSSYS